MKSQSARLREAEEKFNHNCREFAESIGVTPEPCTTRKPTPAEALELCIKLPWHGKVQVVTPADLTPDLFGKLEAYGVFRGDITEMFGFKNAPAFYTWLRNNNVPISGRCGARIKPLRSHDVVVTKRNGKAALVERATEIMQDKLDAAIAGEGPIPGPADVIPAVAHAVAEGVAQVTRDQVEEFFRDAEAAGDGPKWPPTPAEVEYWNKTLAETPPDPAVYIDEPTDLSVSEKSGLAADQHHYNAAGDFQPIEVMQASMPQQQFIGFLRGNVIKYTMRAGRKDDMRREIDKVIQYATWWRAAVDGKTIDPREAVKP